MDNHKYIVFTDGACLNNGKKNPIGAIGIYFNDLDPDNLGQIIVDENIKITNQTMELLAAIKALQIIDMKIQNKIINPEIIYVYTDSTYIINSITKWYPNWIKNNWLNSKNKPVENKELIQLLYELKTKYITIFKHVRSHQKEPVNKTSDAYTFWYGNHMADFFATNACKEYAKEIAAVAISDSLTDAVSTADTNGVVIKPKRISKKKMNNTLNI